MFWGVPFEPPEFQSFSSRLEKETVASTVAGWECHMRYVYEFYYTCDVVLPIREGAALKEPRAF